MNLCSRRTHDFQLPTSNREADKLRKCEHKIFISRITKGIFFLPPPWWASIPLEHGFLLTVHERAELALHINKQRPALAGVFCSCMVHALTEPPESFTNQLSSYPAASLRGHASLSSLTIVFCCCIFIWTCFLSLPLPFVSCSGPQAAFCCSSSMFDAQYGFSSSSPWTPEKGITLTSLFSPQNTF